MFLYYFDKMCDISLKKKAYSSYYEYAFFLFLNQKFKLSLKISNLISPKNIEYKYYLQGMIYNICGLYDKALNILLKIKTLDVHTIVEIALIYIQRRNIPKIEFYLNLCKEKDLKNYPEAFHYICIYTWYLITIKKDYNLAQIEFNKIIQKKKQKNY